MNSIRLAEHFAEHDCHTRGCSTAWLQEQLLSEGVSCCMHEICISCYILRFVSQKCSKQREVRTDEEFSCSFLPLTQRLSLFLGDKNVHQGGEE